MDFQKYNIKEKKKKVTKSIKYIYIYIYAAAKSLQPCPTLCDPRDGSPPGSSIHGIFQARVLEWGAIAFSIITHYYLGKKKKDPILKANFISVVFIIFVIDFVLYCLYCIFESLTSTLDFQSLLFGICYQFYTYKNPIFSTHFYLGMRSLA